MVSYACDTCVLGAVHVAFSITDEVGVRLVNVVLLAGVVDHFGVRLAAVTGSLVLGQLPLGMVGAVVQVVQMGTDFCQLLIHPIVDIYHVFFRVVAAGDAALVGDQDGEIAFVIDVFYGFFRAGDPDEVLGAMEVVDINVQGAVAVEEDGLSGASSVSLRLPPSPKGKVLRAENTVSREGFLFAILKITALIEEVDVFLYGRFHIGEALVVAGGQQVRRVSFRVVLVFALEDFREFAIGDFAFAHRINDGLRHFIVAVSMSVPQL